MIEHRPWRGQQFNSGIRGQRIAIVGYSHHRRPDYSDHEGFTELVVSMAISGELKGDSFFSRLHRYFGGDDKRTLWNQVLFFNFLPDCIGVDDQRFGTGTSEQIERAQRRFLRILDEHAPEKVMVFTTKGWRSCPPTEEEKIGGRRIPLGRGFPGFSWGTYNLGRHTVMAFGLRHPQGARSAIMTGAVLQVLSMDRTRAATSYTP